MNLRGIKKLIDVHETNLLISHEASEMENMKLILKRTHANKYGTFGDAMDASLPTGKE